MPSQLDAPAIRGDRKRGPLEAAGRVVPGFTRADLARDFATRGFTRGAEIGVADGRHSLTLCEAIPGLLLYCIDPWAPYAGNRRGGPQEQHDRNYATARERLAPYNAVFVRGHSMDAVAGIDFKALDFVYIDGNHARAYVKADLDAWAKRVRPGGIVAGHDYYHFNGAGVVEAVNEYTAEYGITDWWLTDEREPSFWWVVS